MKRVLGLDLGTNSIGWAVLNVPDKKNQGESGSIIATGVRIIPMSQDTLGKFDSGQSISQTAERTRLRGMRRLRERHLLRRERLHRVLHLLGFLPAHYAQYIDFKKRQGQFLPGCEPKLPYTRDDSNKPRFYFSASFEEMLKDFAVHQPQLLEMGKKVPYDWTIYYLRAKALRAKIQKDELAWLLLHFNKKRGYNQLRDEDEEGLPDKKVEFCSLQVTDVVPDQGTKDEEDIWYSVHLENGWIYRRKSKVPLDWKGKTKDFIVTTDLNSDGSVKTDKSAIKLFTQPTIDAAP